MDTPRRSGIPIPKSGPVYRQGSMESSFSMSNGNLLRAAANLSPSPTDDLLLQQENVSLKSDLQQMKKQIVELQRRFKEQSARDTIETMQFEQKKAIKTLQNDLERQMLQHRAVLERNAKFRQRLNEVLPLDDGGQMRDISLLNGAPISHVESRVFVGDEDLDGAIMQVEKLKGYINKLELQIYEMNEKVSELIENTQQLERENKSLKAESESMNSVAKMVTDNMKESIETNKRLEEELRKLKSQNEQLLRQQLQTNQFVQQQQQQLQNRISMQSHTQQVNTAHYQQQQHHNHSQIMTEAQPLPSPLPHSGHAGPPPPIPKKPEHLPPTKRITEMHEAELTQVVEEELKQTVDLLNCRLEVAEKELFMATNRAEVAEMALNELRRTSRLALNPKDVDAFDYAKTKTVRSPQHASQAKPPPPPPPPLPPPPVINLSKLKLKLPSHRNGVEGERAGSDDDNNSVGGTAAGATGMDALISELKNGRVTLRRRQAPRDTKNAALQELFAVLEHSQQQNRQSKTFLINHKYNLHEAATTTAESEQF